MGFNTMYKSEVKILMRSNPTKGWITLSRVLLVIQQVLYSVWILTVKISANSLEICKIQRLLKSFFFQIQLMLSFTLILCDSSHVPKETGLRAEYAGNQIIPVTWMHIYIQNKPINSWEGKKECAVK